MSGKEINELIQTGELAKIDSSAELVNEAVKEPEVPEELLEAAEAHADKQLDDIREEKHKRKKALIKLGIMLAPTAIVLIFASIAWFTINKETTVGSMAVKAGVSSFNLATKEAYVSYEDVLKAADDGYNTGSAVTLPDKNGDEDTYYMLSSGGDLILQCKDQSGEDEAAHGNKNVQPSDWDKLELYIVPSEDGSLTANISLEVIPFATLEIYENDGETPVYVTDDQGQEVLVNGKRIHKTETFRITTRSAFVAKARELNNTLAEEEADKYMASADYVRGHIIFFGGLNDFDEDDPGSFYFTDPYTEGTFTFSETGLEKDTAYEVPLYWMWPNTLGQIALPGTEGRKGIPVVSDSASDEKSALVDYLKTNKSKVFANLSTIYEGATDAAIEAAIDSIADPEAASLDTVNFKKLSEGYNKADFNIGYYISYFVVEINVQKQG